MKKAILLLICLSSLLNAVLAYAQLRSWKRAKEISKPANLPVREWFDDLRQQAELGKLPGFRPSDFDLSFLDEDESI